MLVYFGLIANHLVQSVLFVIVNKCLFASFCHQKSLEYLDLTYLLPSTVKR